MSGWTDARPRVPQTVWLMDAGRSPPPTARVRNPAANEGSANAPTARCRPCLLIARRMLIAACKKRPRNGFSSKGIFPHELVYRPVTTADRDSIRGAGSTPQGLAAMEHLRADAVITRDAADGSVGLRFLRPNKASAGPFAVTAVVPNRWYFAACSPGLPLPAEPPPVGRGRAAQFLVLTQSACAPGDARFFAAGGRWLTCGPCPHTPAAPPYTVRRTGAATCTSGTSSARSTVAMLLRSATRQSLNSSAGSRRRCSR